MRPRCAPLSSAHPRPALGASPKTWCAGCQSAHPTVPLILVSLSAPRRPPSPTRPSEPSPGTRSQLWDKHTHTHVHTRPHMRPVLTSHTPQPLLSGSPDPTRERGPGGMAGSRHSRRRGRRGGAFRAVGPASPLTPAWQRFPRPLPSRKVDGPWAIAPRCWGLLDKGDIGSSAGAFGKSWDCSPGEKAEETRGEMEPPSNP